MKKQFYRLIGARGSKTEVLNDDLLQMEKHIENVRTASQVTSKKLCHCMQTHGAGDLEKRQKRLLENTLSLAMQDASKNLLTDGDPNPLFGSYLKICAEVQSSLAKEKAQYESDLEENIISPLQNIADTEIPLIMKMRERLKKFVSDSNAAEQNYHKMNRTSTFQTSTNSQGGATKSEALKEEWDQANLRMEQCRDQLVVEMFEYLRREIDHSQLLAQFHSRQLEYHENCARLLRERQSEFGSENTLMSRSFGKPLSDHLRATNRDIALPVEACVLCLRHFGLEEEGIFRVGGGAAKLRKVRAVLDGGKLNLLEYDAQDDIHAVAGALKQYFRELPDPLLTFDLFDQWIIAADIEDHDEKLKQIWSVINMLPTENKANFQYLMKFCALVVEKEKWNKMSAGNIALVLAPNLLWATTDDVNTKIMVSHKASNIVEKIITYADYFFPEDIDFVVTPNATFYHTLPTRDSDPNLRPESPAATTAPGPFTVPLSPTVRPKSKTHSRSSSTEMNLSDSSSSAPSKPRKHKGKAPPPPPQQLPPVPKPQEEGRSPAPVRRPVSQENKHPVAAKRSSMKKPQIPPPNPPMEEQNGEEPTPKPRPLVRKGGSGNHPPVPPNKPIVPLVNSSSPSSQRKERKEEVTSFASTPESPTPPTPEPRKSSSTTSFKLGDDEITETVQVTPL